MSRLGDTEALAEALREYLKTVFCRHRETYDNSYGGTYCRRCHMEILP